MAIDLLNSFLQRGQKVSSGQKSNTSNATQITQNLPQNLQVMRAIRALQAGQTIQGEVVSVKGDEVQLAIMKDVLIDARLAQSMNLTPGTTMPFQVKANTSQGLSLIPLFTNTAADPNALKALDMAQVPVNDRSLEMVQSMMEKGMSIDKQSIQEMYRDVTAFRDAIVRDIVSLHQMKMPVNQENLTQFSMYQNNQHYLKEAFGNMGNAIGGHLESLVAEGKTESALHLVNQIRQLFQNADAANEIQNIIGEKSGITADSAQNTQLFTGSAMEGNGKTIVLTEEMLLKESGLQINDEKYLNDTSKILNDNLKSLTEDKLIVGKDDTLLSVNGEKEELAAKKEILQQEARAAKEQVEWEDLIKALTKEKTSGKISDIFGKIWNKEISRHWMMEPETVMEKEKVKDFYEKLNSQIKQLEQVFKDANMEKSPVAKVVQNTASNLDFMNQLNQMHAYIQLPLKMANQNAHGELYVFANRKNLSKQNGKVTALLHLDMEYLGKMDVYVALENQKVSTNFYLEKEEYLYFLESHMDMLTDRLNKRGYTCDIKTILRNSESEPMIKTIEKQQGQPMMLSMQAFDVRA